jgi:hypothetical protein
MKRIHNYDSSKICYESDTKKVDPIASILVKGPVMTAERNSSQTFNMVK